MISLKGWDDTKVNVSLPRAAMDLESLFSHEWSQGQAHAVLVLVLLLFVM